MKPLPRIFTITGWTHDPHRRKHRWRCQGCQRVIEDGSDVTVERRGRASHGYHSECFKTSSGGYAARLRDHEDRNPRPIVQMGH